MSDYTSKSTKISIQIIRKKMNRSNNKSFAISYIDRLIEPNIREILSEIKVPMKCAFI
jgi:hypothetical protein